MPSAAQLRSQIQTALAHKAPSALTPAARAVRPVSPTGVASIDALLQGGLPAGAISEFTGPACSGRVSLAVSFVAGQIAQGQVCAWVDAADGFDPASAEASGVDLERLLWVRCGEHQAETQQTTAGSRYGVVQNVPVSASIGMHPRMEVRGLAVAVEGLLTQKLKPGTPSAPNRPLEIPRERREQIASDRLPARRGEHALEQKSRLEAGQNGVIAAPNDALANHAAELARIAPRCAETQQGIPRGCPPKIIALPSEARPERPRRPAAKTSWDRLDQAIRAADLLLQGGGFGCIVMDLSGIEPEFTQRIPLATWFRFRAAADRTRASLLVLTRHPATGSSGEVLLKLAADPPEGETVMTRVPVRVELARQRFTGPPEKVVPMRKPPRPETAASWRAPSASWKAAGGTR